MPAQNSRAGADFFLLLLLKPSWLFLVKVWEKFRWLGLWFFFPFTHFRVLFQLQAVFLIFPLFSFAPHPPPTENLKNRGCPQLVSQHNWRREKQPFVLGTSQPMGCHPKTKFKHTLFTECFHAVKIQLQFKTASWKLWRKWIIPNLSAESRHR